MEPHTKTLADYLDLVKRRKYCIGVTWALVTLIAVIVAYNLPKIYRSTATLLIEAPVPAKFVDTSVSQYGEEQIQSIYQRVLSTDNILAIIESSDLYHDIKDGFTKHELAEVFRGSTDVELRTSSIAPKAHSQMAEIAFDISFSDSDPVSAKEIASQLASLFIEQNDKARTQRATKATEFLTEETDKLNRELQEIDAKIAQFKEQHPFSLPEQVEGNQAAIDRAESELRDSESQIRATKERIAFLTAELARVQEELPSDFDERATPKSKGEAVRMLRAKYFRFSGVYSPSHPSLIRLKREIKALDPTFEGQLSAQDIQNQLAQARSELELLKETYAGNHPDIARRKKQIDKLERQLKIVSTHSQKNQELQAMHNTNPLYFGVEAQYKSSLSELESLTQKQDYLKAKIENLHNVLIQAPQVEMAYTDMIRTRDNIIKKYNQLKEKRLDAKLAQTLEEQQQGQTLTLIEQPVIPRHPEKAIRRKVAIGGFFMGLVAGLGVAFLLDFLEPGIRGYRAVRDATGLMPLVVIPYIESPYELQAQLVKQGQMRKAMLRSALALVMLAIVVMSLSFLGAR
ncbi:GumC family protein [Candidatus Methylomicrobium oryzae]|jgi:succinoglycan biosynthesis transport protein ExoP|uniref:GumC family protein n=1 Tax=Candidatus Methylomicrobium oryzae TaxID=2802053 RepID=UPI00192186C3|nr:lipopolysaccharide biosynthesis protein [Methylomicrobium sp. RS1]MBL1264896.1 lipopolysaccharide biosynthesis protein [Methylomicrobium sp. RS1]